MAVDVFADLTNRKFVASSKGGSPKPFASPFHQDKLYFSVQPLEIDSIGAQTGAPYEVLDGSAFSLSVLVADTSGTTLAGLATSWSPNGTAKIGSIDLNTAAMATAFTSPSTTQISAEIYFQFDDGANRKTTIKDTLTIKRSRITGSTPSELPVDSYLTRAECLALFVKWSGNPAGKKIALSATGGADGADDLILGENSDKSFGADAA